MMSSRQRLLVIEVTAVAAPLILVYFARGMLSSAGPIVATMNVNAPMLPPVPVATTKPLTEEQEKAAEWVRQMPMAVDMRSPLNHPTDKPPPVPVKKDEPKPTNDSPIRGLKLSAVLGNNGEQLASINGKIYAIGSMVRPGLKLIAIDPREYIITLEDEEGQTYEIKRDQK